MDTVYKKGFHFGFNPSACLKCPGYCCCGDSGEIWVDAGEIREISSFLGEVTIDFLNRYVISIDNRLSLKEHYTDCGFACIFFDQVEKNCRIYPVRPGQCLKYPFWPRFRDRPETLKNECPGIVSAHSTCSSID